MAFFGGAKHEKGVERETRAVEEGAEKMTPVHTPVFVPFHFIFSAPSAIARVSRSSLALRFSSFALETSLIKKKGDKMKDVVHPVECLFSFQLIF